jgi:hypothetical protein
MLREVAERMGKSESQVARDLAAPGIPLAMLAGHSAADAAALCLASPEFQWR